MDQPKWKTIQQSDDSQIQIDETGVYPPELEIAQAYDNNFILYRFPIEQLDKDSNEWFMDELNDIASYIGSTVSDIRAILTGPEILDRAWIYESIGQYFGFENFDGYPQIITEEELNKRWE